VPFCSSVSNMCLVIVASYLWVVSECGGVAVSWEWLWYQVVSRSELLDGIVWCGFPFVSILVFWWTDELPVTCFLLNVSVELSGALFLQSSWPEMFFSVGVLGLDRCMMCRFVTVLFCVLPSLCGLWTAICSATLVALALNTTIYYVLAKYNIATCFDHKVVIFRNIKLSNINVKILTLFYISVEWDISLWVLEYILCVWQ